MGLIVLNEKPNKTNDEIIKEALILVRKTCAVVAFKTAYIVNNLPKTRSGKILRATISKILNGEEYKTPATIEDKDALRFIKEIYESL